jgi:hypothetical protein
MKFINVMVRGETGKELKKEVSLSRIEPAF